MTNFLPHVVLLIGVAIVAALAARAVCTRLRVPPLVGWILIGIALAAADGYSGGENGGGLVPPAAEHVLEFLAGIGVVALLFRIGLESNLTEMRRQFRNAVWVWFGNVALSGVLGYLAARYLLGLDLLPSLFAATALTATSLGVSLVPWRDAGALDTPAGGLLVDVAELDDLSAIILMIVAVAIAPVLLAGNGDILGAATKAGALVLLKAVLFIAVCVLVVRAVEQPLPHRLARLTGLKPAPDPLLIVLGTTLVIAAVAGWLGFSLAVGAAFAGMMFSRHPEAVHVDASFSSLYDFFTPFFFIHVGLGLDLAVLGDGLWIGAVLLAAGVIGKVAGTAIPARLEMGRDPDTGGGWATPLLLGVSMVPRAEIAMVVMAQGALLGPGVVPPALLSGMVLVVLATALVAPLVTARMLAARAPAAGD